MREESCPEVEKSRVVNITLDRSMDILDTTPQGHTVDLSSGQFTLNPMSKDMLINPLIPSSTQDLVDHSRANAVFPQPQIFGVDTDAERGTVRAHSSDTMETMGTLVGVIVGTLVGVVAALLTV
ncbi:hypothetical protein AURDEDRAFT_165577 [Auricularia subglabra TFB-10046 SS5]|nr:hypothetical protein AURDEDRAFT_165577 [Auricularia subglabra TFB-10046 SS5]